MLHLRRQLFVSHRIRSHSKFRFYSFDKITSGKYDPAKAYPIEPEHEILIQRILRGLMNQERSTLAKAITLIESRHPKKRLIGQILLQKVITQSPKSKPETFRIGLSGPPGAGKSTFIETLGTYLTEKHHMKVAVLAIDPSSSRTGGSLLGDKTRMPQLSRNPKAYIRPSPAQGTLGGVTRTTTEAMTLCESAGYDIIIVETVGVGQSEVAVSDMTDMFLLLIPPASGDELQGIKRGIVELVDMVIVNKSDGDLLPAARRLQAEYTSAMKFVPPKHRFWKQKVRRISSVNGEGIDELWCIMDGFHKEMAHSGRLCKLRKDQRAVWMWNHIKENLFVHLLKDSHLSEVFPSLEDKVRNCQITPGLASDILLDVFFKKYMIT